MKKSKEPEDEPLLPSRSNISWSGGEIRAAFVDALDLPEHQNKAFIRFTSHKDECHPHAWILDRDTRNVGLYEYDPYTRKISLLRNVGY